MLDDNTYGNSKAATILVEILKKENNPKYTRKVGVYFNEFANMANALFNSNLPNEYKTSLCQIWKDKCIDNINNSMSINDEIKRFLCNIIVMKWRMMEKLFKWKHFHLKDQKVIKKD